MENLNNEMVEFTAYYAPTGDVLMEFNGNTEAQVMVSDTNHFYLAEFFEVATVSGDRDSDEVFVESGKMKHLDYALIMQQIQEQSA